jgi:hypothetical protein
LTLLPDKQDTPPTPAEVRVMPRHVELPAGFPTRFTARVIDQYGADMEKPDVKWSASGGRISPDGVFTAPAGKYVITAVVGDVKDESPVVVGERFWESFDTKHPRGWETINLAGKPGQWLCPPGGNTPPLQSLMSKNDADSKSAFVWRHGVRWKDYACQADVIYPTGRRGFRSKGLVGIVVRSSEKGHYRFEFDRSNSTARFVRRLGKEDKVLAETDKLPKTANVDPSTNPISPGLHGKKDSESKRFKWLKAWGIDRARVVARGSTFQVTLNDARVFDADISDDALPSGTAGLFAGSGAWFDNVVVSPAK